MMKSNDFLRSFVLILRNLRRARFHETNIRMSICYQRRARNNFWFYRRKYHCKRLQRNFGTIYAYVENT